MTTLKLKTFDEMKSTDSPKPLYLALFISSLVIGLGFLGFHKIRKNSTIKNENKRKTNEKELNDKKVDKTAVGEDDGVNNDDDDDADVGSVR